MIKLILSGCGGYMGKVVTAMTQEDKEAEITAGIDIIDMQSAGYPVFKSPQDLLKSNDKNVNNPDALIDFSAASALGALINYGLSTKVPLVLCATGYSPEQTGAIEKASEQIPVFRSSNMSVGINLLADLVKRACAVLGEDFDIEITERHHRRKVDAPSGTALMLADAASESLPYKPEYVFERESRRHARGEREIGISAVRGGTIVGVHDVIFAGTDEVIEFRHTAASRDVFAAGALRAAKFIAGKPPGLYSMKDVLKSERLPATNHAVL